MGCWATPHGQAGKTMGIPNGDFLVMFLWSNKNCVLFFFRDFMPHFDVKVFFSCRLCGK